MSDSFREVEKHMKKYHQQAEKDREEAVENHLAWLKDKRGDDVTPYLKEAKAFKKIVDKNKELRGNQILES